MGGGASNSQALRLGLWFRYWLGQRLAPYHGTPPHVARRMLQLARVTADDRVVDLGCGDARLLIADLGGGDEDQKWRPDVTSNLLQASNFTSPSQELLQMRSTLSTSAKDMPM